MSVASLANTKLNIYSVTTSQDVYGANYETYSLKYSNVSARIRYLNGQEDLVNGKMQNIPLYRIYIGKQLNVLATDLIVNIQNRKFDILYVNRLDRKRHIQIDAKYVTSIYGDTCPNIINSVSASIVLAPQAFPFFNYVTVENNGTNTKNHFIQTYTGSTVGKTASNKTFFGDYGDLAAKTTSHFQLLLVNGVAYWLKILTGNATTGCCTDLYGQMVFEV